MAIPTEGRISRNSSSQNQQNPANNTATSSNSDSVDVPDFPVQMPTPSNTSIVAGTDCEGNSIYLGQVIHVHDGLRNKLPAFIIPAKQDIMVFHNGFRIQKNFIYLEHTENLTWTPHQPEDFKPNAFKCGVKETTSGFESIYVGRIFINGRFVPGRVSSDQRFLFLPGPHQETQVMGGFEILVKNDGSYCSAQKMCQCCIF